MAEATWKGLIIIMIIGSVRGQLDQNFYSSSCPNLEQIVKQAVQTKVSQAPITIPSTLRLFFHDCFIEGCDASIMISSLNRDAEKDAQDNLSLAGDGFDTVIKAKQSVETACPSIVSCSDVIAIAARDVVVLAGGPSYSVELGRRDGLISQASRVAGKLPEPSFDLSQLTTLFAKNNLTQTDMIALSGAHTIGASHCGKFSNRLYSFSPSSTVDPSLDPNYAQQLMESCPKNVDPNSVVTMDPVTPNSFDNVYFQNLVNKKGLFSSDQVLFTESASNPTVTGFANNPDDFANAFITAMKKLGRVGVKTGSLGEIRKDCRTFNS